MRKLLAGFCYVLYNIGPRWLPSSTALFCRWTKWVRYVFAKGIIKECGKNVNVQSRARFSYNLIIGDNSGLGENCLITPGTKIGKNVMMGADVIILTQNQKYTKETVKDM